jgi:site-specific DNA-methyltransferase (cytosine-N4-specific)
LVHAYQLRRERPIDGACYLIKFPYALPEFFIKLLTDEGDIVLDPFAGSNTTGAVSEKLGMRWISIELLEEYLLASKFRF